jgi:hypothetical protein
MSHLPDELDCEMGFDGEDFYIAHEGNVIAKRAQPDTDEWEAGLWISHEPGWRVFEKRNKKGVPTGRFTIEYNPLGQPS